MVNLPLIMKQIFYVVLIYDHREILFENQLENLMRLSLFPKIRSYLLPRMYD